MKIEILKPVEGKRWPVGHTVDASPERAAELIEGGFAKAHPTVTDPGPERPCPCEDTDEPCEECDEKAAAVAHEGDREELETKSEIL